MRDRYYLPWEREGVYDTRTRAVVADLALTVSLHSHWTKRQAMEKLYRLIGWMCR